MLALSILFLPLVFAGCPTGAVYDQNFNRCYKYVVEPSAFYLAEETCHSLNGDLVSVSNGFENAMLSETAEKHFPNAKVFWIGASQLSDPNWAWVNGSSLSYTNWAPGEPKKERGQCAFSSTTNGMWTATECSESAPFICGFPFENTTCPAPPVIPGHCGSGWTYYDRTDSCYMVGHHQNFENAEADCVSAGAHLASIHSKEENEFVNILASTGLKGSDWSYMTLIGLFRRGSGWAWTDSSAVDYLNWMEGAPDNWHNEQNCVHTWSDNTVNFPEVNLHHWDDIECDVSPRAYLCKKRAAH